MKQSPHRHPSLSKMYQSYPFSIGLLFMKKKVISYSSRAISFKRSHKTEFLSFSIYNKVNVLYHIRGEIYIKIFPNFIDHLKWIGNKYSAHKFFSECYRYEKSLWGSFRMNNLEMMENLLALRVKKPSERCNKLSIHWIFFYSLLLLTIQ